MHKEGGPNPNADGTDAERAVRGRSRFKKYWKNEPRQADEDWWGAPELWKGWRLQTGGKGEAGRTAGLVNDRWCHPVEVQLLATSFCPHSPGREFTCVTCQHWMWHHHMPEQSWWSLRFSPADFYSLFLSMLQRSFSLGNTNKVKSHLFTAGFFWDFICIMDRCVKGKLGKWERKVGNINLLKTLWIKWTLVVQSVPRGIKTARVSLLTQTQKHFSAWGADDIIGCKNNI